MRALLPCMLKKCSNKIGRNRRSIFSKAFKETLELEHGKKITISTDNDILARSSAYADINGTGVLVAVVSKEKSMPSSFVPLKVDYYQTYASAGCTPQNIKKRELGVTDSEILTGRCIDRSVRPIFPQGFSMETELTCQLRVTSGHVEPDVVGINAASAALVLSDIPWNGPIGAVRVGLADGQFIVFPNEYERSQCLFNLVVTGVNNNKVVMLQGNGNPIPPNLLKDVVQFGLDECSKIIAFIKQISEIYGKPKLELPALVKNEAMLAGVRSISAFRIREIFTDFTHDKLSRDNAMFSLRTEVVEKLQAEFPSSVPQISDTFDTVLKNVFRDLILEENIRCDNRNLDQIRDINCDVNLYDTVHGSSKFRRGQTVVESIVAYGDLNEFETLDPLIAATGGVQPKNFKLNYVFPSYCNDALSKSGRISRREVGHGTLAQNAVSPIVPNDYPYFVLVDAMVKSSNGSSSMATICGATLALLDAGVPIVSPAAGIAMGVITDTDDNGEVVRYKILTDLMGIEDFLGDMDFKIGGTREGITALQADIKLQGISTDILNEAIDKSVVATDSILDTMNNTIANPRVRTNLPVRHTLEVTPLQKSAILGAGGSNLRRMSAETSAKLTWESNNQLRIFADNETIVQEILDRIEKLGLKEPVLEFGQICLAKIVEIRQTGVMVKLYENMLPAFVHVSSLSDKRVTHMSALNMEVGSEFYVKYLGRDPQSGHMRLSAKGLKGLSKPHTNLFQNTR